MLLQSQWLLHVPIDLQQGHHSPLHDTEGAVQADSMTDAERESFREHVSKQLTAASVECGHTVMHQFTQAELQAAGMSHS